MTKLKTSKCYQFLISYIIPLLLLLLISCCKESEETKVKNTCSTFIKGRKALRKGDETELKSVTEDSLFKLIKLNQQYFEVLKTTAQGIETDLDMIHPISVKIMGDSATCQMSSMENYEINLRKYKGIWKVKGENGITASPEKIANVTKKIVDYKVLLKTLPAQHKVITYVNSFFDATKRYFKTQQTDSLKVKCTNETLDFIKRLYTYSKQRTGMKVLTEEIDQPNYLTGDVYFKGDKSVYLFYHENTTIDLTKHNNTYLVSGLNGQEPKHITMPLIEDQYLLLLRALKLVRQEQYRNKDIK